MKFYEVNGHHTTVGKKSPLAKDFLPSNLSNSGSVPVFPDQRSLTDQLKTLLEHARNQKMYDAYDWLKGQLDK